MSKRKAITKSCWRYDVARRTAELLAVPQPTGRSAVAAGVGAHLGVLLVPALPHPFAALLGVLVGMAFRLAGMPRFVTILSAVLVPMAAGSSLSAAEAIGQLDQRYLPTALSVLGLTAAQEVAHHLYQRSSWTLIVPVLWKPKESPTVSR